MDNAAKYLEIALTIRLRALGKALDEQHEMLRMAMDLEKMARSERYHPDQVPQAELLPASLSFTRR